MKVILVIDDDKSIRETVKDVLEDEGYKVLTAESGANGIKICKNNKVDIAIIDIWLPQMDGITVLQEIKKIDRDIKSIVISAHGSVQTAVESLKLGAIDYLEKPLSLSNLIDAVKKAAEE